MKKITINKALKLKNRLAGEVANLESQINVENSRRVDQKSKPDVGELFVKLKTTRINLINLKASINRASAPIADKLVEIAELKSELVFYNSLNTKEGGERAPSYGSEPIVVEYEAHLTKIDVQQTKDIFQDNINNLQDDIDEYNAQTFLDKEF